MSDALSLWNVDWPNANSQRKYPLHPSATARDLGDTFTLPNDVLVGLYLPISADADFSPERAYLKTVGVYPSTVVVQIGYDNGTDNPVIFVGSVPTAGLAEYDTFTLAGVGRDFVGSHGTVQVGRPATIRGLPVGEFAFDRAGGRLDPDCVRPVLPALSGIVVVSGDDRSELLTGVVELEAGNNCRITPSPVYGGATLVGYKIRIDAIDGAGLTDSCDCSGQDPQVGPVKTLNGIPPDADGNITLGGGACMGVSTGDAAIALSDLCSKPCCGNEVVDKTKEDLDRVSAGWARQQTLIQQLTDKVDRMTTALAALRLNDAACGDASSSSSLGG